MRKIKDSQLFTPNGRHGCEENSNSIKREFSSSTRNALRNVGPKESTLLARSDIMLPFHFFLQLVHFLRSSVYVFLEVVPIALVYSTITLATGLGDSAEEL